jgi:predicted metalloprotease
MTLPNTVRRFAAALLISAPVLMPVSTATAEPTDPRRDGPRIRVTSEDVRQSNDKIAQAYSALADMWTKSFSQIGERFAVPRIARYTGAVRTACGVIGPSNAQYCPNANAIYYDEVFVAGMGKAAANSLGTDGDMASVGIIAHEMGHAVATQLGHRSRNSYTNESTADCLAGAFAKQSQLDGYLESGDIEEAFYGMSLAGDPEPEATGNARYDAIIQARLARQAHGTKDQRMDNFRAGLDGGARACLSDFR